MHHCLQSTSANRKLKYLDVGYTHVTDKGIFIPSLKPVRFNGITKEVCDGENYDDSEQLSALGYNYCYGVGVEKDEKKGFGYYMKAAKLGNSNAVNEVGLCCYNGTGVERNYQKSFEYYKKSADLGNAFGMCNVGKSYNYGHGVDQDYNKAFEYFKKSANTGNKEAMYSVTQCYRNGTGTKRDIQSANYWFKKYRSLLKTNKSPDQINAELKIILDDERFKLS
ncbi:hypothetical protein C2G38_2030398 [Gigaspora rosea]|uniref:HCP-like protein n=1 Tax=Gigaspora rosea TaxID=44941 RepID=A0A397W4B3_9GLOM|nr:hypothetical protein C2G38_2030398 [Gigaspora rosea]